MTGFVLVPGACHGGWWYEPLVRQLQRHGHRAWAPTPAGLGEAGQAGAGPVTLERHIEEITAAVRQAAERSGEPVVLVGHSYGGTVITGAADREPRLVSALVYLDAFVPEDGDSCWSMTNEEQRRWYIEGAGRTGLAVDPLPFFDERARAHPLATLVQRITLTGAWRRVPKKIYAAATGWPQGTSPFAATSQRLADDPEWTHHALPTRHNVLHDGPQRILELLLTV